MIDLSINGKGMDEDRIYAMEGDYRAMIRRGNTLIEIDGKDVVWGRKGFRKFFDIHKEYIDFNLGQENAIGKIRFRR